MCLRFLLASFAAEGENKANKQYSGDYSPSQTTTLRVSRRSTAGSHVRQAVARDTEDLTCPATTASARKAASGLAARPPRAAMSAPHRGPRAASSGCSTKHTSGGCESARSYYLNVRHFGGWCGTVCGACPASGVRQRSREQAKRTANGRAVWLRDACATPAGA